MTQGIISLDDREFTNSLGSWTGDATWETGPVKGYSGVARLLSNNFGDVKTMSLSYPRLATPKGKEITTTIHTYKTIAEGIPRARIRITDGVYSYTRAWQNLIIDSQWITLGYTPSLPVDWDKLNAILSIDFESGALFVASHIYLDFASLFWMSKPQHLPVMGIG
jgi:hypothetical protein